MNKDPPFNEKEAKTLQNIESLITTHKLFEAKSYFVLSYAPPTELTEFLNKCNFFAYIYHDCDEKEPHYHYFLTFSNNKNPYNLAREMLCGRYSFMIENVRNRKACLRYLIHLDDGDKFQYPLANVTSNNFGAVERACRIYQPTEDNGEFIKDICYKNPYENAIKYGRDYIRNFAKYQEFRGVLINENLTPQIENDEALEESQNEQADKSLLTNLQTNIIRKDMEIARLKAIISALN